MKLANRFISSQLVELETRDTPAGTSTFIGVGGPPDGVSSTYYWQPGTTSATTNVTNGTTFQWFGPGSNFPVQESVGDINGDGIPDVAIVAGAGGGSQIGLVNGSGGVPLVPTFSAFESGYNGGLNLTMGDIDKNGGNEVVVAADQGGGPRIKIYSVIGGALRQRADFFGIDDANFRGGARVALGDVNGDGTLDLIVAAGIGGGPRIAIYNGKTLLDTTQPTHLVGDFFAFESALRNGSYVASGDFNGDGKADVAFGGGPGGGPRVYIAQGSFLAAGNFTAAVGQPLNNFYVGGSDTGRGGVRVTTANIDGDNVADLVVGSGSNVTPEIRTYLGKTIVQANGVEPPLTQSFNPYASRSLVAITSSGTQVAIPQQPSDVSNGVFVG